MTKLQPCPLCQCSALTIAHEGGSDERSGYNFIERITCSGCGLNLPEHSQKDRNGWSKDTDARERLIKKWNTR